MPSGDSCLPTAPLAEREFSPQVGDPFSLVVHGSAEIKVKLQQYVDTPFTADSPFYFFDKYGKWTDALPAFDKLLEPAGKLQGVALRAANPRASGGLTGPLHTPSRSPRILSTGKVP
jgi:hypothetical protein